jgi:hypothetical protein
VVRGKKRRIKRGTGKRGIGNIKKVLVINKY